MTNIKPIATSIRVLIFCLLLLPAAMAQGQSPLLDCAELFHSDRVVKIDIELAEKDWDEIRLQSRDFASALGKKPAESPFTWVKANITIDGQRIENVGIRKKGFLGSLSTSRPSLKVKFGEYVDQNPVAGLTHMTLNNNKQDPARVLQYLTYKLFTESGTHSPRCGFAVVSVNGENLGVYSNVESIREPMLEHNFGDGSGPLFEGTVADFFPERIEKFEKKNKAAKRKHVRKLADVLAHKKIDLEAVNKVVDVDAFIRYWAMESLVGFWDSYCSNQNNYFVYKNPANKKLYFVPWGADSSFAKSSPIPPYQIRPRSVHGKAILPNKLYRIPEIQSKYVKTLRSFMDEHWQEDKLLKELDRLEMMLKDHLVDDNTGFARTMKSYRKFIVDRRKEIDSEFENGNPELKSREHLPVYMGAGEKVTATFDTKWYDQAPFDKTGLGKATIKMTMDGEEIELGEASVVAELSKWPNPGGAKPATVVFTVTRKSDDETLTIAATLPTEQFKPSGDQSVGVGGVIIEGSNFQSMKFVGGTAKFEVAKMEDGEAVKGSLSITASAWKGGKPVDADDEK
jgi:spore coat protein CotH